MKKMSQQHLDFKRGYIRALFLEDERWIDCITKYWMIVPGDPKNQRHIARDLALKEKLADGQCCIRSEEGPDIHHESLV